MTSPLSYEVLDISNKTGDILSVQALSVLSSNGQIQIIVCYIVYYIGNKLYCMMSLSPYRLISVMSVDSSLHYTCNPFAYHDIPTSTFSPQLCLYSTLNRIKELLIDLYSLDSGRLTNRIVSNKTSINYTLLITDHCLKKTNRYEQKSLLMNIQISNYFIFL